MPPPWLLLPLGDTLSSYPRRGCILASQEQQPHVGASVPGAGFVPPGMLCSVCRDPPLSAGYVKLDGNGEGAAGSWPSADLLPSAARGSHHGNNVPKEQLPGERGRLGDSPGAQGMMDEPLGEGGQSHSCTVVSKKGGGCWGTMMGLRPPPSPQM